MNKQETWIEHVNVLANTLRSVSFLDGAGRDLEAGLGFEMWKSLTLKLKKKQGTVFLVGNGASASMASHFSADLAKNAQLHTEVFSDLSLITAISNDMGYEQVFSEPLSRRIRPGDMLVAISSSGRSPNVLAAMKVANKRKAVTVTLSAKDPDNPLRRMGTLNIYIPAQSYGFAESGHAVILHHWMDRVETAVKR